MAQDIHSTECRASLCLTLGYVYKTPQTYREQYISCLHQHLNCVKKINKNKASSFNKTTVGSAGVQTDRRRPQKKTEEKKNIQIIVEPWSAWASMQCNYIRQHTALVGKLINSYTVHVTM